MPDYRRARYIGRVFQDPMAGTAPDLTIEQNLSLALKRGQRRGLGRGTTSARRKRFRAELETLELGLENRLKTKVGLLSGGYGSDELERAGAARVYDPIVRGEAGEDLYGVFLKNFEPHPW